MDIMQILYDALSAIGNFFTDLDLGFRNFLATQSKYAARIIYIIVILFFLQWLWKKAQKADTSYPGANEMVKKCTTPKVEKHTDMKVIIKIVLIIAVVILLLSFVHQGMESV